MGQGCRVQCQGGSRGERAARRIAAAHGFTLIEILIVMALMLVVASATMAALTGATAAQSRDQAYGDEVTSTQAALTRLTHDLRQATAITQVTPSALQFQILLGGLTYNVRYDCSAADSLGGSYRRCARTSAPASGTLPSPGSKAGPNDIQHVANGTSATYCNTGGTAQNGVFVLANPAVINTNGSGLACDEAYETILANQLTLIAPTYLQVMVKVPASGDKTGGGLSHQTVLQSGAFLQNLDSGA